MLPRFIHELNPCDWRKLHFKRTLRGKKKKRRSLLNVKKIIHNDPYVINFHHPMNHCHLANVVHKRLDDIFVGFHIIGLF